MIVAISFIAAAVLAVIHLIANRLRFLDGIPRSRWLSIAGGVSVAYVFLHLLPELSEHQETLAEATTNIVGFLENHVYLLALLGLVIFYGLERAAKKSRKGEPGSTEHADATSGVFWIHTVSFAVYNALIGYLLLHRFDEGLTELLLFFVAMGLHFVVNDYGLREHYKHLYHNIGRWVLAAAILAGWTIGLVTEISEVALATLIAFLSGGIILNVLKEELPEERESRFGAFALGASAYAALLLAL